MKHKKTPVYLQLRDKIADAIIAGEYSEGGPLPSVRAYAAEQGANPLTVAKAYQLFQDDGLVEVRRGIGMFVAPGAATRLKQRERDKFIAQEWPEIRKRMSKLEITFADLTETS